MRRRYSRERASQSLGGDSAHFFSSASLLATRSCAPLGAPLEVRADGGRGDAAAARAQVRRGRGAPCSSL